jgi:xanthine phosphoribosyltransferase
MQELKQKILTDGRVKNEHVLAVDSFLNHQLDIPLFDKMGEYFFNRFKDRGITKILTIESSGIAVACFTARYFNVPVVFARKTQSLTLSAMDDKYCTEVYSFTKQTQYSVFVSQRYLNQDDVILLIDDFLANGQALMGMADLVSQAGAKLAGAGIVIEKAFQEGGGKVREAGIEVCSLARIQAMKEGRITFID